MKPDELSEDRTGTINETVTSFLEEKNPSETIPSCATLETYEDTTILIPVNITEESIESVARKISGRSVPGGTDSEALQGFILEFGEDITRLLTSIETFVDWIANGSPPWAAYHAFMSGWLIAFDKHPGVRPVGIGETRRRIFSNIVIKVTGPEATMGCKNDQLCDGLKAGINGAIHGVQAILDENLSTEEWFFNS